MSTAELASVFRAYLDHVCEAPSDVEEAMHYYDVRAGLGAEVRGLLEQTECPGEAE